MNRRTRSAVRPLALVALLALALGLALLPAAQAQTSGANLIGRVADKDGTPLPGVTVTVTQKETGLTRSTITESDGSYRLPSVPVGTYTVQVELDGFATVTVEEVRLNVATQREINVDMSPSTVEETITVTAEAPLVQTEPAIGTVVSEQQLENLPLNGRQFANLAILAPGTTLAYNSDPTKPGQLTIALNGGIGRNVNFLIDGGDNTDDTIGGALQNFNLESVAGVQHPDQQYKAEYGRSTGGVLTVVTKTGTNDFAGAAWGFFRDDSLNFQDGEREDQRARQAALRAQAVRRHRWAARSSGTRRTSSPPTRSPSARRLHRQHRRHVPGLDGQPSPRRSKTSWGPPRRPTTSRPKQYLQVRYGFQKNTRQVRREPAGRSRLAGHHQQRVQLDPRRPQPADRLGQPQRVPLPVHQVREPDHGRLQQPDDLLPVGPPLRPEHQHARRRTNQTKYQYKDDLSFTRTIGGRANNFKVGVNYIHEPVLGGDFSTGLNGQFHCSTDDANSPVTQITFIGGFVGDDDAGRPVQRLRPGRRAASTTA